MKGNNIAINEMATELIESKRANRQMSEELEILRAQMQEMQLIQSQKEEQNTQMMRSSYQRQQT